MIYAPRGSEVSEGLEAGLPLTGLHRAGPAVVG
jgi:hypothetical protein